MKTALKIALFILGGIAVNRLDKHLVEPAIPLLPGAPLAFYNIVATVFALVFLLAIVLGIWLMLRELWRNATQPDARRETRERIRKWPTSKSDLILPVTMAYFAGIMVPMVAAMLVLPSITVALTFGSIGP